MLPHSRAVYLLADVIGMIDNEGAGLLGVS